jgi:hypothetical protein
MDDLHRIVNYESQAREALRTIIVIEAPILIVLLGMLLVLCVGVWQQIKKLDRESNQFSDDVLDSTDSTKGRAVFINWHQQRLQKESTKKGIMSRLRTTSSGRSFPQP